jgi:hypothetical protein
MIKGFSQFINESDEPSIENQLEVLRSLLDLGLISDKEFKKDVLVLTRSSKKYLSILSPEIQSAMETPGAKAILAKGLELSSSNAQLMHGTIVLAKPGYFHADAYGLGFFPSVKRIRRLVPHNTRHFLGWTIKNPLDPTIKIFPANMSTADFYRIAMQWAADHIDFEKEGFYSTGRTKKGYFDQFNRDEPQP